MTKLCNFPLQPTLFVGRGEEVDEVKQLLVNPACRLLTLIGPGGVGKTSLSTQAVRHEPGRFADGVYFVPLQAVHTQEFLVSAVADALDVPLTGSAPTSTQLINYLQNKEILLLLDNFEQLLPEGGADLLAKILAVAPRVMLVVTSREVLNLREEWLYSVPGLPVPKDAQVENWPSYGAVQLFIEHARRLNRDFSPIAELPAIIRICQLAEGTPLAIELAASWTRTMDCTAIATEIQRNYDFLTSHARNMPNRQRSMRAVFDQSWQLLAEAEREAFKRLSVFRGSFQRDAAEQVAGASLADLLALVDKSLLRAEADQGYRMHELLHQYATEKLLQSPEAVAKAYDIHCAYYANFLNQRAAALAGSVRQGEIIQKVAQELPNIRAAWLQAVAQHKVEEIQQAIYGYYLVCDMQGRFQESTDALQKAIDVLETLSSGEQRELTLAQLLTFQGWNNIRLGRFDEVGVALQRALEIYQRLEALPPLGFGTDPLPCLGLLAVVTGNYEEALRWGEQARRQNEARGDRFNLQCTYYVLANAAFAQGKYDQAMGFAHAGYRLTAETSNSWMMAYVLSLMGNIARAQGDYAQARQHYLAGYKIKEDLNDPEGVASTLNQLGQIAWLQEDFIEAGRLYHRSHSIYQRINDRGGLVRSLHGLGDTALARDDSSAARRYLNQALQLATEMNWLPLTLSILASVAGLLCRDGRQARCVELLAAILYHPASDQETKDRVQELLDCHQAELSPEAIDEAIRRGQGIGLEVLLPLVQTEMAVSAAALAEAQHSQGAEVEVLSSAPQPLSSPALASPALVEQLTAREIEVLHHIAAGLTNQQIADDLIISVGTVKSYTSQIYGKLGVGNRTQAVARARELALLA
jgi:predicted ATPase/DNA-binding NarL/FixJ family response regulator